MERCESGRIGLPAKELYAQKVYRGFESPPLRNVPIAQLDRASDCGSGGRWFESTWAQIFLIGEVRERLNRAVSKTVVPARVPGVRIPPSPQTDIPKSRGHSVLRRDDREAEGARLESVCTLTGTGGSNPPLSVSPLVLYIRPCAITGCPTPSGPEGSSGKRFSDETRSA
jgi:hypothetical protein